ncbi:hypothetical protein ABZ299_13940 [Streptomyces sp. NPDC006184]|uniref:hypothetical protein n=1 Tax=Streptomyces sp. NPDC006184 TaxID=3155455 RepID=UPI0033B5E5EA
MEIAGRELAEGSRWDREAVARDAGRLRPVAGYDLTRHHGPELIFAGPVLVSCPRSFRATAFRPPTTAETAGLARTPGDNRRSSSRSRRTPADRSPAPA